MMFVFKRQERISVFSSARQVSVCCALLFTLLPTISALAQEPAARYQLGKGQELSLYEDGSLILLDTLTGEVVLGGHLDPLADTRRSRSRDHDLHTTVFSTTEGQEGGHRGFSNRADDDADGLIDEDPLDGLDNDRDGLRDEDFAAISDNMTVLHLLQGNGEGHLECMHWTDPHLKSALFLNLQATHALGDVSRPSYNLDTLGDSWAETDLICGVHDLRGVPHLRTGSAFISRLSDRSSPSEDDADSFAEAIATASPSWLGVMVLNPDRDGPPAADLRPRISEGSLGFPLSQKPLSLVVCKARSWTQLNRLLMDASAVYEGVQDPVTGQRARWIVPPRCVRCREESDLNFTTLFTPGTGLEVILNLERGHRGLLDPDLFSLGNQALGVPETIRWIPEGQPASLTEWQATHPAKTSKVSWDVFKLFCELELDIGQEAPGQLSFSFPNFSAGFLGDQDEKKAQLLQGAWVDGRTFSDAVELVVPQENMFPSSAQDEPQVSETEDGESKADRLMLSPALLEGWPNPFRDRITIEFEVPATVEETFDWTQIDDHPEGWEMASPMSWDGGQPSVSVKIYGVNGQELVSLQHGSYGPGQYTVSWNGNDESGRQVASGTYFCKLQLDDYSVTRRIVFLR